MKHTMKMLCFGIALNVSQLGSQVKISPAFYGVPLWYSDYTIAPFGSVSTFGTTVWDALKETQASTIRVGGEQYCVDNPEHQPDARPALFPHSGTQENLKPNPAGYVKIVDDARANGMEPMIQVPIEVFRGLRSIEEQALEAADIVRTVNIIHKRNVRFWIIGNEPAKSNKLTSNQDGKAMVKKYIQAFATKMKDVDPDIKIIGFEHDQTEEANYKPWSGELITLPTGSLSITGTITSGNGQGKCFIDYWSWHQYGGYNSAITGTASPSNRASYVETGYNFADKFKAVPGDFSLTTINAARPSDQPLKLIVNEFNMLPVQGATGNSSVTSGEISGDQFNGNSFLSGQLIVDMMAGMLGTGQSNNEPWYEFSNVWGAAENDATSFIDNGTDKKPTYWHFWLMSKYFHGTFFKNDAASTTSFDLARCYKAYACKSSDYIAVLVMNQTQVTTSTDVATYVASPGTKNFSIRFDGGGSPDFQFNMGGTGTAYNSTIAPSSTSLLFFNCDGSTYLGRYDLTPAWVAANLTALTPTSSGTIPGLSSVGASGSSCKTSGNTVTLTAPSSASWYESSDPGTPILSASTTFTANAGMYYASTSGSCSGQDRRLVSVVNDIAPIISRKQSFVQRCTPGSPPTMEVELGAYNNTWTPTASVTSTGAHNQTAFAGNLSDIIFTVSVNDPNHSCATSETVASLVGNGFLKVTLLFG